MLEALTRCEGEQKHVMGSVSACSVSLVRRTFKLPKNTKRHYKGDLFRFIRQRIRLLLQSVKFSVRNGGLFTFLYCHLITS